MIEVKLRAELGAAPGLRDQGASALALSLDGARVARIVGGALVVWTLADAAAPPRVVAQIGKSGVAADPAGGWLTRGMGSRLGVLDRDLRGLADAPLIVPTEQTRVNGGRLFAVHSVQPTPDGETWVLVASETSNHRFADCLVLGWAPRHAGHRWSIEHATTAVLAPDGETVAVVRGSSVAWIDAGTGESRGELELAGRIHQVLPRGERAGVVVLAEREGSASTTLALLAVDREGRAEVLRGALGFVDEDSALALSPDERWIAATGGAGEVALFDRERGDRRAVFELGDVGDGPASLCFADDRVLLVGASDGTIRVLEVDLPRSTTRGRVRATKPLPAVVSGAARAEAEARARLAPLLARCHEAGIFIGFDAAGFEAAIRAPGRSLADFSSTDLAALLVASGPQPGERVIAGRRRPGTAQLGDAVRALLAATGLGGIAVAIEDDRVTLDGEVVTVRRGLGPLAGWCDARLAAAGRTERVFVHDADGVSVALAVRTPGTPEAGALDRLMFDPAPRD